MKSILSSIKNILPLIALVKSYDFVPNTMFDISYINLERKPERREYMEKILGGAKCNYKRFNAVDGMALKKGTKNISDYCKGLNTPIKQEGLKDALNKVPGTVGCHLSHKILISQVAESKSKKPVLIFEDDILIERDFVENLQKWLPDFDEDWDMILLTSWRNIDLVRTRNFSSHIQRCDWFNEFYAYIVNGAKGAEKISKLLDSCKYDEPIDVFLCKSIENGLLNVFATVPAQSSQHSGQRFPTEIETSNNNKLNFHIYNPLDAYLEKLEKNSPMA